MEIEKAENQRIENEIKISFTSGVLRQKTRVLTVKLAAPKDLFVIGDALSRIGSFPSVDTHLCGGLRTLLTDYLEQVEEVISKASKESKSKKIKKQN